MKKLRTRPFIEVAILLTCIILTDKVDGANCPSGVTFTTETVATTPSNRSRKTIGVGEEVNITLNASLSGSVSWSVISGSGSISGNGTSAIFTAPNTASTSKIRASYDDYECEVSFTIIEPSSEKAISHQSISMPAGEYGAGMIITLVVMPNTVSFMNVETLEVAGPASNITGYFTNFSATALSHSPNPDWQPLDQNNASTDTPKMGPSPPPYMPPGSFEWDIPIKWRVIGSSGSGEDLPNVIQKFTVTGTNATVTVEKYGLSETRSP